MTTPMRVLYGYSSRLAPFRNRAPTEQAAMLRSWQCDAVCGGHDDHAFVAAARAQGLAVYAEFGCFAGRALWERYPAARPLTPEGSVLAPEGPYFGLNPSLPELRAERLAALERLLLDHSPDGVWLDFIRWPCHWEVPAPRPRQTSFDPGTLARFAAGVELTLPDGDTPAVARALLAEHSSTWTSWRIQQINTWVADARAVIRRVLPTTLLGLFGVPWRLADLDGAILNVIGQDYRALGEYVDVFSPMVYHRMCARPVGWIADVAAEVRALLGKAVWPIVQGVDMPDRLPMEEYRESLAVALGSPATEGVMVFHLQGVLEGGRLAATMEAFSRAARSASPGP